MASPFLEAFKVGYAVGESGEQSRSREVMFNSMNEANSLLDQMETGAIPTADLPSIMGRLNELRSTWVGAASASDISYADFKTDAQMFNGVENRVAGAALNRAINLRGTPAASEALAGWLQVYNLDADINVKETPDGFGVQFTEPDGSVHNSGFTWDQLMQAQAAAAQGGLPALQMSEQILKGQADRAATEATTDYTKAKTGAIPVELAIEQQRADNDTANAATAAQEAEARVAAASGKGSGATEALKSLNNPEFTLSWIDQQGIEGVDANRLQSRAGGFVQMAAKNGQTAIDANGALRLAATGYSTAQINKLIADNPGATLDAIAEAVEAREAAGK